MATKEGGDFDCRRAHAWGESQEDSSHVCPVSVKLGYGQVLITGELDVGLESTLQTWISRLSNWVLVTNHQFVCCRYSHFVPTTANCPYADVRKVDSLFLPGLGFFQGV